MIDVAKIDYWASTGTGFLHKASPISKILFVLLVVSAAVVAKNPYPLLLGYGFLLVFARAAGLPWLKIAFFSWYGAFFALVYALSFGKESFIILLFVLKAITPALAVLMLIVSTPYPRIFSLFTRILPEVLAAGLFMTYRSFFIVLDLMGHFVTAIRIRGGFSKGRFFKNASNVSPGIGMLLIMTVERSSRLYATMMVRGYQGSMADQGDVTVYPRDGVPLGIGMGVLLLGIIWR
ncbi:MAG: energy-coupling factor transporter transmembrane component T [Nitrospirota bacterium]